jgi:hypothetical protein
MQNPQAKVVVEIYAGLPNPWLLTWAHKVSFAKRLPDTSFTHFMYTEDDLEVTPINIDFWLSARELLRPFGLYPSFFRVEWLEQNRYWVSCDIVNPVNIGCSPRVTIAKDSYGFINLPNPYQAVFFYDRELMLEHAASESFDVMKYGHIETICSNPNWPGGGVAERANFALTFTNVPQGFTSRNVVPYFEKFNSIDPRCFIHHLPNRYANPNGGLGSLRVSDVLCA